MKIRLTRWDLIKLLFGSRVLLQSIFVNTHTIEIKKGKGRYVAKRF